MVKASVFQPGTRFFALTTLVDRVVDVVGLELGLNSLRFRLLPLSKEEPLQPPQILVFGTHAEANCKTVSKTMTCAQKQKPARKNSTVSVNVFNNIPYIFK
jgi:hypothetical protein